MNEAISYVILAYKRACPDVASWRRLVQADVDAKRANESLQYRLRQVTGALYDGLAYGNWL